MNSAKAIGAGLAGAITTIMVWALNTYGGAAIPDFVQGAFTTVIGTALVYYIPNSNT